MAYKDLNKMKMWIDANKNHLIEYAKKWRHNNKEYIIKYQQSEKFKKSKKKYRQSEKGKNNKSKYHAKRKRNLNWFKMFDNPFADSELIEYHHITDAYVVALPRDLHHLYMGKYHRENTMEIVKQIYLD